jgi:hypothetical protein
MVWEKARRDGRQAQGPAHPDAGQDRQTQPDRRAETQGTPQTSCVSGYGSDRTGLGDTTFHVTSVFSHSLHFKAVRALCR